MTVDGDYWSPLKADEFSSYLAAEWSRRKGSRLIAYRRLSGFFKAKFPDIKIASEAVRDLLVRRLVASPNFLTTHALIASLALYDEFTSSQVDAILSAVTENTQVGWIASDPDVREFLHRLLRDHDLWIDEDLAAQVRRLIGPDPDSEPEDIPF